MALKRRKSVFGDLRKMLNRGEEEPDVPAMPSQKPVETPVAALHIRHYGMTQDQQFTFYSKSDVPFLMGNNYYYVPRCMQAASQPDLDPSIHRFTWMFKEEYALKSTTSAKLNSFRGAYSIWYKELASSPILGAVIPKSLSRTQGEFWMLKQVQDEPAPGETVEWKDIPTDMLKELNEDWWFMGVHLPDIDAMAAGTGVSRGRSLEPKVLNHQNQSST